jgi:hypothetical protein
MRRLIAFDLLAGAFMVAAPVQGAAQDEPDFLAVGETAPDFELVGSTRHGVLEEPVRLSDFRGETIVLTFFFRARTAG